MSQPHATPGPVVAREWPGSAGSSRRSSSVPRWTLAAALAASLVGCESEADGPGTAAPITAVVTASTAQPIVGQPVAVKVQTQHVQAHGETSLCAQVRGGGTVTPAQWTTTTDAAKDLTWTLGPAPLAAVLEVGVCADGSVGSLTPLASIALQPQVQQPVDGIDFGGVDARLEAQGIVGSTEDLAFSRDGAVLVLGVPGGLQRLTPDGKGEAIPLSGDALVAPLGVAFDRSDRLWVCDGKGKALRRVDFAKGVTTGAGVVTTVLDSDEGAPLGAPNHLAALPGGDVAFSDPCLGKMMRVGGSSGAVLDRQTFDLPTEGGPNGIALSPDGKALFVTTENTALLCNQAAKVKVDANIAGLYRVELDSGGFGARTAIATGFGLFGDGLTFDVEGNLYVTLDRVENFKLKESAIEVLPAGGKTLLPFARSTTHVFANVQHGHGSFGVTKLYAALLAVPPFTDEAARGVVAIEVGVPGSVSSLWPQ